MRRARTAAPGWLRRLVGYCLRRPLTVVIAVGASVAGMVVTAVVPLLQRRVVDTAVAGHGDVARWVLLLAIAAVVTGIASYLRRYYAGRTASDVQHALRAETFDALSALDGAGQDALRIGQVVGRTTADITVVQNLLSVLPVLLGNGLLFVLSLVFMVLLSPALTLVALLVAPALWLVGSLSKGRMCTVSNATQQQAAVIAGRTEAAVTGVRVVKGFAQEDREIAMMARAARRQFTLRMRAVRLTARYTPLLQAVPVVGQVAILAVGGWLAISGRITLGTYFAFATYLAQLTGPVRTLAGLLTLAQQAKASVIRILDIIDRTPTVVERPDAGTLPPGPIDLAFHDVTFGYGDTPVLDGFTLHVHRGETVALVGRSGSGKSTVTQLLARFYDVRAGTIRVAGHDVRDVTLDSLRSALGVMPETSFLFADTVHANIAYGRPAATPADVTAAATAAEADRFIRALPDAYDTSLGEQGYTLSGGQRQRIALARTLLTHPRALILDDVTSALDPLVEAEILTTLAQRLADQTCLLITNRPACLALADRVAVLDEGRVIDTGTVAELTDRCALFRQLISADDHHETPTEPTRNLWPPHQPDPEPDDEDPKAAPRPATFSLTALLRPYCRPMLLGLLLVAVDVLAGLAIPILVRAGIDNGVAHRALSVLIGVSVIGIGVVLVDLVAGIGQLRITGRTAERLLYTLRVWTFAQLQRLGLDFYERQSSGPIITRMTTDIAALSGFLQTGVVTGVVSVLALIGVLAALLVINLSLGLLVLTIVPILAVATVILPTRSGRAYARAREVLSTLNGDLHENIAGLRVTQALRRQDHNRRRFAAVNETYRHHRLVALRYISGYFALVQAVAAAAGVLVLAVGVGRLHSGALTSGALIAYLLYVDMALGPVQQLSQVFDSYQQAAVGLRRIADLLSEQDTTPPGPVETPRLAGDVELRHVTFRYPTGRVDVLRDLSLRIRPGQTVALVGATGAGKSSVVKLLSRCYDPTAGKVRMDGVDLRHYRAYRRRIGIVPQESYLFAGTVSDTIAYGRPTATDAQIEAAARTVGAHQMIARLPGGYRHEVTDRGANLSAGQRQLLALARVALIEPDVLLLDEPSGALDLATAALVAKGIDTLATGRTAIVIAHRLTTAARADRIVVMRDGAVVEDGTHAELLATHGYYARLWEREATRV